MTTKYEITTKIESLEVIAKDWSSRIYKKSRITVTDKNTEGDKYYNFSVDVANENRRKRTIIAINEEISSLRIKLSEIEEEEKNSAYSEKIESYRLDYFSKNGVESDPLEELFAF